ncbi:hypothetical protein OIU74_005554, partial [Salix koriyanagi]
MFLIRMFLSHKVCSHLMFLRSIL